MFSTIFFWAPRSGIATRRTDSTSRKSKRGRECAARFVISFRKRAACLSRIELRSSTRDTLIVRVRALSDVAPFARSRAKFLRVSRAPSAISLRLTLDRFDREDDRALDSLCCFPPNTSCCFTQTVQCC
jgi:hypothetical protein